MSAWQLTFMALGTVIGGSFFLGSSVAIHTAGPSIIISYILGGILVYFILNAISEMTIANPKSPSFRDFAGKYLSPGIGFVTGWVYWTGMALGMSSEAAAICILIQNWYPKTSTALLGSIIIIAVTLLNLLGADKLSKLESSLVAVKLLAIISFILVSLLIITGLLTGAAPIGIGAVSSEPFFQGGTKSIAGSMLIVMFAYAGFEVIGLAAPDTEDPKTIIPRAIKYTVFSLVGLYIIYIIALLPLISTSALNEKMSPMVAALNKWGIGWAGTVLNIVLITAIISTMLAAMYGLGRMIRSIANEGYAPKWLKDENEVPYRGILFSGLAMLLGLGFGLLFPSVYIFLISAGGFAALFTYGIIVATYISYKYKCNKGEKFTFKKYPYASWITLVSIVIIIASMPLIAGQSSGLAAGIAIVTLYSITYLIMKLYKSSEKTIVKNKFKNVKKQNLSLSNEFSKELYKTESHIDKHTKTNK